MAAAGCVADRDDDPLGERVLDEEREQRLRQEARLEGAAAVLVRHAALAPVPDRLDDRDADMAGLLLDRVDHGLDPLPHDHRLDLDHLAPSVWALLAQTTKKAPRPLRSRGSFAPGRRLLRRTA
jgi:hypothetical protein